jgi:hypothetical protein
MSDASQLVGGRRRCKGLTSLRSWMRRSLPMPTSSSNVRSTAGDSADAAYYMSEYHIATGNLPLSVTQLEMALAVPDITAVQRSRFQARLGGEAIRIGEALGYKLEEINHLPPEVIARRPDRADRDRPSR